MLKRLVVVCLHPTIESELVVAMFGGARAISRAEFVAIVAALMAVEALAIDVMLPALPNMGDAFFVANPNNRSLVITLFLIGFGLPQLAIGPVSDRFGRRLPILIGLAAYLVAAFGAPVAPNFVMLLVLRFVQGVGAAAIRVGILSAVRDRYSGAAMAEIMSIALAIFLIVPIVMPGVGQVILLVGPWESIFATMGTIAVIFAVWTFVRLPETLPPANRRALSFQGVAEAFAIVGRNRLALSYGLSSMFLQGAILGFVSTSQQVFVGVYQLGPYYPFAFAFMGGSASFGFLLNSRIVGRWGMRRVCHVAILILTAESIAWLVMSLVGTMPLWLFLLFVVVATPMVALNFSNVMSIAMEPLGRVAGTASAVFGSIHTVGGALLGYAVAQAFDGTVRPVIAAFGIFGFCSFCCYLVGEQGKLFGPDTPSVARGVEA
jgi:MFS transporter, DHA1 family, multidrug resistance protein